ncbi:histidine decarboxylase [Paramuricea clavata]|uniref:Histidine decarboxylase n=1 Tax=Paramuricea clavata TaxID=317549 RepID=A0A7D9JCX1_PARCT|nr:histidine decarboxylase [Paramuricea clavata]
MYTARERNSGCNVPDKYHWYPVLRKEDARLSENGLLPEQRESTWNKLHNHLFSYQNTFLGFQANQSFDSERTKPFLDIALNNCGDPFSPSSQHATSTKVMECAVLDYFAKLWGIQQSDASNEEERAYWGYITSNGSSEGNLLALFNARDYLAGMPLNDHIVDPDSSKSPNRRDLDTHETRPIWEDNGHSVVNRSNNPRMNAYVSSHDHHTENVPLVKDSPNNFIPVVFLAEESYHGFEKALRVLQIKTFRDLGSGNFPCPLKYPDDYPTSFNDEFLNQNGANDNPQAAISELVPILKEHGMYERRVYSPEHPTKSDTRNGFWFHVDGALGGAHLRFLEMAINQGLVRNMFPNVLPVFDFRIPEVKSIAMSLHKWFGCPVPAAVFMMRKKDQVKSPNNPLCIGGLDSTLSGSRGGHSVLVMWDLLSKKSYDDFKEIAVSGVQMLAFSLKKLQELQKELSLDLWLSHAPGSLFVYFRQPREDIVLRYSLGSEPMKVKTVDGTFEQRIYSHICLMPHVTKNLVLRFIEELRGPGAFPIQN